VTDCLTCEASDFSICTKCPNDIRIIYDGSCIAECPPGTFPETINNIPTCTLCHANCAHCTSTSDC
jgi:hypothetical protein